MPGKVQAIAIMMLIGGIYALMHGLAGAASTFGYCCLWPGTYYCIVLGIMAIINASQLLGGNRNQPAPTSIGVMMIVNIINLDIINCVMGIIILVFLNEPQVRKWYRG